MSGSVESQRQIQLTFQDKSTDANLSTEVTRESWLNEVQSRLHRAEGATSEPAAEGASNEPAAATFGPAVWEEPGPRAEVLPLPPSDGASAQGPTPVSPEPPDDAEDVAPDAKITEELAAAPDNSVLDYDDVHPREELDFDSEPLPEPLTEASPMVTAHLGSLTLPAALCDEQLLQELAGIPEKMGFKIGEVAEMLGIKQYVLRYWETEFDVLKPKKAANNQRYYTKKDVENVYLIRKLLHRDRFSIEGARAALKDLKSVVKKEKDWTQVNNRVEAMNERIDHLLVDLRKLRQLFAE